MIYLGYRECNEACTPVFKICVFTEQSLSPLDCDSPAVLSPVIITQPYYHTDNVTFSGSIGGQDNPVSYATPDTFDVSWNVVNITVIHVLLLLFCRGISAFL